MFVLVVLPPPSGESLRIGMLSSRGSTQAVRVAATQSPYPVSVVQQATHFRRRDQSPIRKIRGS